MNEIINSTSVLFITTSTGNDGCPRDWQLGYWVCEQEVHDVNLKVIMFLHICIVDGKYGEMESAERKSHNTAILPPREDLR